MQTRGGHGGCFLLLDLGAGADQPPALFSYAIHVEGTRLMLVRDGHDEVEARERTL